MLSWELGFDESFPLVELAQLCMKILVAIRVPLRSLFPADGKVSIRSAAVTRVR